MHHPRRTSVALAAVLVILSVAAACATPPPREGFRLEAAAGTTSDELAAAADVLTARLSTVRPGAVASVVDGGLFVEMPLSEATPAFIERLTSRGEVTLVPVPADFVIPVAGQSLDLPALVGHGDIADARQVDDEGRPALELVLTERGARELAAWSTTNAGEILAIVQDGAVASAPLVQEPILGGEIRIGGPGSVAVADAFTWIVGGVRSGLLELELHGGPGSP